MLIPLKRKFNFRGGIYILFLFLFFIFVNTADATDLSIKLSGRILLQIESKGEAWYVNPHNLKRYYLGRPDDAFAVMKELGIGISNKDLAKIQIADANLISEKDSDGDGLSDMLEQAIDTDKNSADTDGDGLNDKEEVLGGHNPLGKGDLVFDQNFAQKNQGKIFLQVESKGEAWYINEVNLKRYYLGRPADAFNLMRSLGLGITNKDLEQIITANPYSSPLLKVIEKSIQELVNKQRTNNGLFALKWNDDLADVAREHSENLAAENVSLIEEDINCSLPMIHHEGFSFGLYQNDRLKNRKVYYLSASAENIALIPALSGTKYYYLTDEPRYEIVDCASFFESINSKLKINLEKATAVAEKKRLVEEEISYREGLIAKQSRIKAVEKYEKTSSDIEKDAVNGWMNSPGHRANILNGEYDEAGVGIAKVENYLIITQVFITRTDCGYQTGKCCEKKGYYPYCYEPMKCDNMVCGD